MLELAPREWHLLPQNSEISRVNGEVEEWLAGADVPFAGIYMANLTVEELVTNCIKYGYAGMDTTDKCIDVVISIVGRELRIILSDDAAPFDPLAQAAPDLSIPLEDRPIGGLGIHMLRQMSTGFTYAFENGRNVVTITKQLV
jgi:anti-sigma regulatory factor (Ser/Thr protein kinase)